MDIKRIAAVTGGLAVAGAVVGGVLGAGFMAAVMLWEGGPRHLASQAEFVLFAGLVSAGFGVVLGPLAAWLLMRHVPLWLAIGGTALGTLAGIGASFATNSDLFLFPLLGFGASAVTLRVAYRPKRLAVASAEAPAQLGGGDPA